MRVLDEDIERLREEVSVVRLIESSGVPLHKRGADHIGRCPFHEDDAASLVITPDNRWRCPACEVGGDVIEWVVKRNGVSFDRAVELLRDGSPDATGAEPVKVPMGPPAARFAQAQARLFRPVNVLLSLQNCNFAAVGPFKLFHSAP